MIRIIKNFKYNRHCVKTFPTNRGNMQIKRQINININPQVFEFCNYRYRLKTEMVSMLIILLPEMNNCSFTNIDYHTIITCPITDCIQIVLNKGVVMTR